VRPNCNEIVDELVVRANFQIAANVEVPVNDSIPLVNTGSSLIISSITLS
jgi:hypothetical protein